MRDQHDRYYTPPDVADHLVWEVTKVLPNYAGHNYLWVDPSCGTGNLTHAVLRRHPHARVIGVDDNIPPESQFLHPTIPADWMTIGAREIQRVYPAFTAGVTPLIVLANPPFKAWQRHIAWAFALKPQAVVALLPINVLGSKQRLGWWRDHPPTTVSVLAPRPGFLADQDSKQCAPRDYLFISWVLWPQRAPQAPTLHWIDLGLPTPPFPRLPALPPK